jgi:mono/diheme cytochrome c family protein
LGNSLSRNDKGENAMITFWTKSILALPLVGLAIFNLFVMLELLGRGEERFNPKLLRRMHRGVGIVYILLYLLISYFCIVIMRASGQELSARAAIHSLLAVGAFIVLCLKLLFVRVYRKYYALAAGLGFTVVLLTVGTAVTSAGYYFTMRGTTVPLSVVSPQEGLAKEGAVVFSEHCADCHHPDRTDNKVGPGLKGLFKRDTLPVSGQPLTEASIRETLKTPVGMMPPFADMPEDQVEALIAFLRSL